MTKQILTKELFYYLIIKHLLLTQIIKLQNINVNIVVLDTSSKQRQTTDIPRSHDKR